MLVKRAPLLLELVGVEAVLSSTSVLGEAWTRRGARARGRGRWWARSPGTSAAGGARGSGAAARRRRASARRAPCGGRTGARARTRRASPVPTRLRGSARWSGTGKDEGRRRRSTEGTEVKKGPPPSSVGSSNRAGGLPTAQRPRRARTGECACRTWCSPRRCGAARLPSNTTRRVVALFQSELSSRQSDDVVALRHLRADQRLHRARRLLRGGVLAAGRGGDQPGRVDDGQVGAELVLDAHDAPLGPETVVVLQAAVLRLRRTRCKSEADDPSSPPVKESSRRRKHRGSTHEALYFMLIAIGRRVLVPPPTWLNWNPLSASTNALFPSVWWPTTKMAGASKGLSNSCAMLCSCE